MVRTRHWHWLLMAGVFVLAFLLMPRNAVGGAHAAPLPVAVAPHASA
jgi:hypothetical protein